MPPARIIPPPPPGFSGWEELMREALHEAEAAGQRGEVPIGALLVRWDGAISGRAGNEVEGRRDPTAHAEMLALRRAARGAGSARLEGCFLISTLEPCLMCAGALPHARLAGLVYGARDAAAGAVDSCLEGLDQPFLNHRVWRLGGVLEDECAKLLRDFFLARRT
ncbi:MAG: nucleoside deaminase [Desulfovibrio sp.]|jgi:tRNA(adenine34) deaminase|nr:nucleoside deaminase [Desulfovibrio sp.]